MSNMNPMNHAIVNKKCAELDPEMKHFNGVDSNSSMNSEYNWDNDLYDYIFDGGSFVKREKSDLQILKSNGLYDEFGKEDDAELVSFC